MNRSYYFRVVAIATYRGDCAIVAAEISELLVKNIEWRWKLEPPAMPGTMSYKIFPLIGGDNDLYRPTSVIQNKLCHTCIFLLCSVQIGATMNS